MTGNRSIEKSEGDFDMIHKDNSDDMYREDTRENVLERVRTAGTISMSPELFEKLYLGPQNTVAGDLRKTFGNPTPLYVNSLYRTMVVDIADRSATVVLSALSLA